MYKKDSNLELTALGFSKFAQNLLEMVWHDRFTLEKDIGWPNFKSVGNT